ncbi:MAG: hypothetical protein OEX07_04420, partial [Gammaproteobacteria bacterium]|nr:hypothetical protein [Gammaproteobacteria bacterium]
AVRIRGKNDPVFVESLDDVPAMLENLIEDGDIVLTLGAGDVGTLPGKLISIYGAGNDSETDSKKQL